MKTTPYVFVLCSSTNIDRIGAFYHANPKGRLFICDSYQKKQLETVRKNHGDKSGFYNFHHVYDYAPNLDKLMSERGFVCLFGKAVFQPYNVQLSNSKRNSMKQILVSLQTAVLPTTDLSYINAIFLILIFQALKMNKGLKYFK